MTLRLNGSNSGFTEVKAPATAGSNTITLPTSNGSANQYLKNGSTAGALEFGTLPTGYQTQLSTSVATTSGSAVDFTIPSYAKRITVMAHGTSVATLAYQFVQIGSGGTPATSGYLWYGGYAGAAQSGVYATTSFTAAGNSTGNLEETKWVIQNFTGNTWSAFLVGGIRSSSNYYGVTAAGHIALSGTLNIVRFGTSTTFDAGSVNIFVEG